MAKFHHTLKTQNERVDSANMSVGNCLFAAFIIELLDVWYANFRSDSRENKLRVI